MKIFYSLITMILLFLVAGCREPVQPTPNSETAAERAIEENLAEAARAQKEYAQLQKQRETASARGN